MTPGSSSACATTVAIACWYAGSASVLPSGAAKTIRPVASPAPGIFSPSWSSAACALVPGMENEDVIVPEKAAAAPPSPSNSASQTTSTAHRRRVAKCPRR